MSFLCEWLGTGGGKKVLDIGEMSLFFRWVCTGGGKKVLNVGGGSEKSPFCEWFGTGGGIKLLYSSSSVTC